MAASGLQGIKRLLGLVVRFGMTSLKGSLESVIWFLNWLSKVPKHTTGTVAPESSRKVTSEGANASDPVNVIILMHHCFADDKTRQNWPMGV